MTMQKSFFSASKLGATLQGVSKGTKTSNDYRPEVVTARALNKFTINASASTLMNLQDGEFVYMINNPEAETLDGRFLIAKAPAGAKLASTGHEPGTGRPLSYSYSSIWSQMVQMKVDAQPLGGQALLEAGIMFNVPTMEGKSADLVPYKVAYEVVPVMNEEGTEFEAREINGVVYPQIFALVNMIKRDIATDDTKDDGIDEVELEDDTVKEKEAVSRSTKSRKVDEDSDI